MAGAKSLFTAQSAENNPGAQSSAATHRPESSESAGKPVACAAAWALMAAFSENMCPVSAGTGKPRSPAEVASIPKGASNSRISRNLPALWVAMMMVPESLRAIWAILSGISRGR